jgi:hypothetical protein
VTLAPETIARLGHLRELLEREPAEPARILRRADRRARRVASNGSPVSEVTVLSSPAPEAEPQSRSVPPFPREQTPPTRIVDPRPFRGPLIYCPRDVQTAFESQGGTGDLVLLIEAAIPGPVAPRWVNLDGYDVQLARTSSPLRTRRAWRAVQIQKRSKP